MVVGVGEEGDEALTVISFAVETKMLTRVESSRRRVTSTIAVSIVGAALILLGAGCGKPVMEQSGSGSDGLDHRLLRHTYVEDGRLVTFAVNTDATRRREKSPYVPIGIVIANNGTSALTVDRESLILIDDTGQRYPMATVQEFKTLGTRPLVDLQASSQFATLFYNRLQGRNRVSSVFFPIQVTEPGYQGRGVVLDVIEIPRDAWIIDVVYFPHPANEMRGRRYELWFKARELADPIFVRFAVD